MNKNSKQELLWWIKSLEIFNGTSLLKQAPQVVLQTDAPVTGWGAALQGKSVGGTWYINELELLAAKLALQTFLKRQNFTSIHMQMDNIVALAYLKKMEATKNQKMIILSKEIWEILISKQIIITVEYLPSSLNKVADLLQSGLIQMGPLSTCSSQSLPEVTHQAAYVAWKLDPYSIATNAMPIPWTQGHCYAFLPFCLIPRVPSKIQQDQVHTGTLITPSWQTQLCYPQVLGMLIRDQL